MNISVLAGGTISSSDGVAIYASNAGPLNLTLGGTVSGSAAGNVAVQLGSIGPNTVTQTSGSNIVGAIVGGSNVDSAILAGAGVQVQDVNRLLKEFEQMQTMMKKMSGGGMMKMMKKLGGMKGMMGGGGGFPGMR